MSINRIPTLLGFMIRGEVIWDIGLYDKGGYLGDIPILIFSYVLFWGALSPTVVPKPLKHRSPKSRPIKVACRVPLKGSLELLEGLL